MHPNAPLRLASVGSGASQPVSTAWLCPGALGTLRIITPSLQCFTCTTRRSMPVRPGSAAVTRARLDHGPRHIGSDTASVPLSKANSPLSARETLGIISTCRPGLLNSVNSTSANTASPGKAPDPHSRAHHTSPKK